MATKKTPRRPMTPSERKAYERARYAEAGKVKREYWIHPDDAERISAYIARVGKERARNS